MFIVKTNYIISYQKKQVILQNKINGLIDKMGEILYNLNMKIKTVKLVSFRNYDYQIVDFPMQITLVSGANGQGKTNLVESIVVSATTKSPRTSNMSELIKDGSSEAKVEILLDRKFGQMNLSYTLNTKGEKKFFINSNPVSKMSEVFGNLVVVYFSPDDLKIVSASPDKRRDFMDTDISELSGSYYNLVQRYNKVLLQRNKLLKTERDRALLLAQIGVWDEQLAQIASLIIKTRKSFIEKLKTPAKEALKFISSSKDDLESEYVGAKGTTAEEIKAELLKSLKFNLDRDIELGYTTVGPHRDDIYFGLNGKDARNFASQGQQRSIVLALKFAELEIFEKEIGEEPILVLDDVFSELDTTRQRRLYEKMSKYQTIITGTQFKFKPVSNFETIRIKEGNVARKKVSK